VPVQGFAEGQVGAAGLDVPYAEAGTGAPLLLVPGAGGLGGLGPAHLRLARDRRVIAVDLPGLDVPGLSTAAARGLAGVLGEVAAALGLERYALAGWWAGGTVALWHAVDAPAAVRTLVLLAPAALPAAVPASVPVAADADLVAALPGCAVPTLVLFGDRDEVTPASSGRRYQELLPRCVFTIVYRAGHDVVADRPAAVADWVADFLDRGPAFAVTTRSAVLHQ
jgi:pimeloyl-ACP methyl ester carboxylesterase